MMTTTRATSGLMIPGHARPEPIPTEIRWIGTPEHFRWLELILRSVLVLNLLDAILTLYWIETGAATEANPVMADLAHGEPVLFVLVKLSLVCLGSLLLWKRRTKPLAVIGITAAFLAYYGVLLYHLHAMNLQILSLVLG